jgi:hypothetical protein
MTSGAYLLGIAGVLLFSAAVLFCAYRVRIRLLPSWSGAIARLAEIVLAASIAVCLGQLLGVVGLLSGLGLLAGAAALALTATRLEMPTANPERGGVPAPGLFPAHSVAIAFGALVAMVVVALWLPDAARMIDQGIWGFDSMWHHLPAAARFAQTGSVTSLHFYDPVTTNWFFPSNSELLHGIGIALVDRDILSPLLNLGWLGVALLAAWSIGRPYGASAFSLFAVSTLLVSSPLITSQAARAKPDIASIALLAAAAAILLNGAAMSRERGAGPYPAPLAVITIGGLAAGLAMGTRINAIPVVAILGLGLIALAGRGGRRVTALAWFVPVLVTGGFWYMRNLFAAGNPLPFTEIGVGPLALPAAERGLRWESFRDSIADVITEGAVWRDHFIPGLELNFGDLWFLVLALALAGMIGSVVVREAPVRALIGTSAFVGVIVYLFTPYTAGGPGEAPTHFGLNVRYVMPVLALGLALAPTLPALRRTAAAYLLATVLAAALIANLGLSEFLDGRYRDAALIASAALIAGVAAIFALVRYAPRLPSLELVAYASALVVVTAGAFWPIARDYLDDRYTEVWPGQNVSGSFRWASEVSDSRIALAGTTAAFFQYGYYGRDLSNRVEYIGRRGPRGSFAPIEACAEWRAAINHGDFDYLVTSPTLNETDMQAPGYAPEREWLGDDPAASLILDDGPVAVFALNGPLDPASCAKITPLFSGLPPLLRPD